MLRRRQTTTLLILTSSLLPLSVHATKVEMPAWNEAAEAGTYALGGGLWPDDILEPEDGEAEGTAPEVAADGTVTDASQPDLTFFG
ncbi:MAG: hypothetical protein AAF357_14085, partial [Verrucomicrobiota bacterium]